MAKLMDKATIRKESKNGGRRYTLRDMAIIKHDASVTDAQIKRGEIIPRGNNRKISLCGCGVEGCFLHISYPNREVY